MDERDNLVEFYRGDEANVISTLDHAGEHIPVRGIAGRDQHQVQREAFIYEVHHLDHFFYFSAGGSITMMDETDAMGVDRGRLQVVKYRQAHQHFWEDAIILLVLPSQAITYGEDFIHALKIVLAEKMVKWLISKPL